MGKHAGFLHITGLRKRFPNGTLAVDGIDLEVAEGELVALLGPSGCGKTTTLRCIAGLEDVDEGSIELAGRRIDRLPPNRRDATMVFQGYALFPHLSVFENVAYGLRVRRVSRTAIKDRVSAALALVDLVGYGERRPQQLSGGQQQRVALARALVLEPKLLLFDEPLSNLDARLREQMRSEIRHLQQRVGVTSVYVTHDQGEALALADRVAVMDRGRVVQMATPRAIYEEPATRFVADFVGQANFVPGVVQERQGEVLWVGTLGVVLKVRARTKPVHAGDAVDVLVRPEQARLVSADDPDAPAAVVLATSFLGGLVDYRLKCGSEELLVRVPREWDSPIIAEGTQVGIRIAEGALRAYSRADADPTTAGS